MDRRQLLASLSATVTTALAGCPDITPSRGGQGTPTESAAPTPQSDTSPVTTFRGTGSQTVDVVTNGGLAIAITAVSGSGDITATLTVNGTDHELTRDQLSGDAVWVDSIPAGTYPLTIDTDSEWQLTAITPSTGSTTAPSSQRASGVASDVFPLAVDGTADATASFTPRDDTDHFTVTAYQPDGTTVAAVYDTTSEINDQPASLSHQGVVWVVVDASSNYSLTIE